MPPSPQFFHENSSTTSIILLTDRRTLYTPPPRGPQTGSKNPWDIGAEQHLAEVSAENRQYAKCCLMTLKMYYSLFNVCCSNYSLLAVKCNKWVESIRTDAVKKWHKQLTGSNRKFTKQNKWKKARRETQTLRAGCSKVERQISPRRRRPSRGRRTAKI